VGWSTWHIQWCTKYRYKIFGYQNRKDFCKLLLAECAKLHKFEIFDLEVDVNHVHVIASLPLTMTPLQATQYMKGDSARGMFIQFPELRKLYRKGHLWSPGKFVGSVGHITLDKAKNYLEAHHAKSFFFSWNPSF
jgi:putative transposase